MARLPIYATEGGRFKAKYRDDEGRQRSRTFDTKRAAADFLAEVRTAKRHGTYIAPDAGRERFEHFAREWAASQDWATSTRLSFAAHLRRVLPHLGRHRLDTIDRLVLERMRTELTGRYAHATARISFHYACAIMRAAYHAGRIARDPTVGVRPPRPRGDAADNGKVGPDDVPTRAEVVAILTGAPAQYRAAVALGACGLRVGEVMGTTVGQLNLDAGSLVVDRQLQRQGRQSVLTRPKREKVRTIDLPGWARLELRRHVRERGPFWPLHGDRDGGHLLFRGGRDAVLRRDSFYESAWRPALVAAGLAEDAYVFHSLRHWCASWMLAEGAPVTAVAGHLGDTVETVTRTYAHWLRDDRHIPAAILDGLLAPRADEERRG